MNIGTIIRTLLSRFLLFIVMVLCVPFILFALCVPIKWLHEQKPFFYFADLFYRVMIRISFINFNFVGRENVPDAPVIFAANHSSSFDIPLVGILAKGKPHLWLAKSELMDSPILRFVLPHFAILVDMSSPLKGMRSLLQAINWVNGHDRSLMIFPEGGRFTDDYVHDFYGGFVILAKKTGLPIVPVYIDGLNKVYPPNTFWVQNYPVKVVIGEPMKPHENEEDEAFKDRVYQWFLKQQG